MLLQLTNETKVGIFTIVGLVVLILGFSYMQGLQLFSPSKSYYAVYENVDGLKESNPVIMQGYEVGKVTKIEMRPQKDDLDILVKFNINKDVDLPQNTTARIINHDLLGAKALSIERGDAPQIASENDTLQTARDLGLTESVNQLLAPVKERTEHLISSVDTAVNALNEAINRANLESMFESVNSALTSLDRASGELDQMVVKESSRFDRIFSNVESITQNFEENNEEITNAVHNFSAISDSLAAADIKRTITQTTKTIEQLEEVIQKINNGDGTASRLLNDDELYKRLNNSAESLDELTKNIRDEPHRYLNMSLINFGRSSSSKDD